VGTGSDILITGFALSGSGTKQVLIRAVGPALNGFAAPGALGYPRLEFYDSSGRFSAAKDNWGTPVGSAVAATAARFGQVGPSRSQPASATRRCSSPGMPARPTPSRSPV